MRFRSVSYTVKEAVRGLIKNRLMSFASIITLASCLFMVSVSFCLVSNLDYILFQMESMMNITVYLRQDMTDQDINTLIGRVNRIPHVTHVQYVSQEEALNNFREDLGDSSDVLAGLDQDNPLPASLVLDIDNISNWDDVENNLNVLKNSGIETIQRGKQTANALTTINNVLRVISALVIAGLGAISLVIIFNTIRIAVNNRKTEINIMKYVGATDAFIRGPFVIEGMIIGILGALLPLAVLYPLYDPVMALLKNSLQFMDFIYRTQIYIFTLLAPLLLIVGLLIGIIGSAVSIRRHLNV